MRITLVLICTVVLWTGVTCQLVVDATSSVEQLLLEQLLGPGLEVSNISFNGNSAAYPSSQCGYFQSQQSNVGLPEGIILSSGNVLGAIGPNTDHAHTSPEGGLGLDGDADLDELSSLDTHDAAVLEFDFVAQGDSLLFRYVFASEEYPEFANTIYNDVFGFFISGPGYQGNFGSSSAFPDGAQNIATIPNSDIPISINSINNGDQDLGPCEHCEYLAASGNSSTDIQYDGVLIPMEIRIPVSCGETYHIKIAIADAGDFSYDSAIFLEKGSFQSNASYEVSLEADFGAEVDEETYYEGCYSGDIRIQRSEYWSHQENINLSYVGSALNGIDFDPLPSSLEFNASASSFELPFSTIADGINEGIESVEIQFHQNICGEEYTYNLPPIEIHDAPEPLSVNYTSSATNCTEPVNVSVEVSGGMGYYDLQWSDGQSGPEAIFNPDNTPYLITSDSCSSTLFTFIDFEYEQAEPIMATIPASIELMCGNNSLSIATSSSGGVGELNHQWIYNGESISSESLLNTSVSESGILELELTDECEESLTLQADVNYIEYEDLNVQIIDPQVICIGAETRLESTLSGGLGPFTHQWSIGDSEADHVTFIGDSPTLVQLSVTDACGQTSSDWVDLDASEVTAFFILEELDDFNFHTLDLSSSSKGELVDYYWTIDGTVESESIHFENDFVHEEENLIGLTVYNEFGCHDSYESSIQPSPAIYLPTAFSPDGDGLNEVLEIKGRSLADFHMVIFNRKGHKVFESRDLKNYWKGHDPHRAEHSYSSYLIQVEATGLDGTRLSEKGLITVLR